MEQNEQIDYLGRGKARNLRQFQFYIAVSKIGLSISFSENERASESWLLKFFLKVGFYVESLSDIKGDLRLVFGEFFSVWTNLLFLHFLVSLYCDKSLINLLATKKFQSNRYERFTKHW